MATQKYNHSQRKTFTSRTFLVALLMLTLPICTLTKISIGGKFPTYKILKNKDGNSVQMDLSQVFELSEIKYDSAKFEIKSGGGEIKGFKDPAFSADIQSFQSSSKFVEVINKNTFILAETGKDDVTLVRCLLSGFPLSLACNSNNFQPTKGKTQNQGTVYVTEAVAFDPSNKLFYVAWTNKDKSSLIVEAFNEGGETQGQVTVDLTKEGIPLSNRIRLEIITTPHYNPEIKPSVELFAFDQKTSNGKDESVSLNTVRFNITQGIKDVKGELYRFVGNSKDIDAESIGTYYEFENQLFFSSKRKDQTDKLCLTRLKINRGNSQGTLEAEDKAFYCTDNKSDFIGFGQGNQIFSFNKDQKTLNKVIVRWGKNDITPITQVGDVVTLDDNVYDSAKTGGIREIHEGENTYVVRFAKDTGTNDSGDSTIIVANEEIKVQFTADKGIVNAAVNTFNIQFTAQKVNYMLLKGAYFTLNSLEPENNRIDIQIVATDSETTEGVTAQGSWYVIDDPFDKVEISSYVHPPLEIYPGGYSRLIFPYSTVLSGNDLNFELNFGAGDYAKNLVQKTQLYHEHQLNIDVKFNKETDIKQFQFMSGAAVLQNKTDIYWFICGEENEFATQCLTLEKTDTYGMNLQSRIDGSLQVVYSWTYKEGEKKTDYSYSYFTWYEFGLDGGKGAWQYEHYDGRIIDIGHMRIQQGEVYTIIAFEDKIMVSLFFDNWSYGNRKNIIFGKDDINDKDFCPKQVMFNPKNRNTFYVFSDCDQNQQIIEFSIDMTGKASYIYSHFIGSKLASPEICVLSNEIVIFERSKRRVTSIDNVFSFTQIRNDYSKLKINDIADFACFPQENQFFILNKVEPQKPTEKAYSEVVVFNGGEHKNIYRRIKMRLSNLPPNLESVQPFYHKNQVAIALFNDDGVPIFKRFCNNHPTISVASDNFVAAETKEIDYTMIIRSNAKGTGSVLARGKLRVLKNFASAKPILRKDQTKQDVIKDKVYQVSSILDLNKTPIFDAQLMMEGDKKPEDYFSLTAFISSEKQSFDQGKNVVGKMLQLQQTKTDVYYFIASYSKSSSLKYGGLKMYKKGDNLDPISTFYGYNSFNSVSAVQKGKVTLISMVTSEGQFSALQVTIAINGMLSTKSLDIDSITDFTSVDIIVKDATDSVINAVLIAYSANRNLLTLYNVQFNIGAPSSNDDDPDMWSASKIGDPVTSDNGIGSFSITVTNKDAGLNVYYKNLKDATTYLMQVDIAKSTFGTPMKVKLELPTIVDAEVAEINCVRFKELPTEPDQCAFSTYGAVIYYATNTIEEGKMTFRTKRLLKDGDYYGTKVSVIDRFVMLETERINSKQDKRLMIWDVTNYDQQKSNLKQVPATPELPLHYLMDMRTDGRDRYSDSRFLDAQVEVSKFLNFKVFIFVQNEYGEQGVDDYGVFVDRKELTPWILGVKELPASEDDFKKVSIKFVAANGKSQSVPLTDFLNWKKTVTE